MTAWQDLRYGVRFLFKRPGFTAIVIAVLAICIGANTAIFSVVDAVLLNALPYREPGKLVSVSEELKGLMSGPIPFSAPDYLEVLRRDRLFESAGIYRNKTFELSGIEKPDSVTGVRVSASLFPMLGISPALGRNFTEAEDRNSHRVAILSNSLWRSKFGSNRRILGKQILLDRISYTVIGVMPPNIVFPQRGPRFNNDPASVFVPISFTQTELKGFGNMYNDSVIARLRPGVSLAEANSELQSVARQITRIYPASVRMFLNGFGISAIPLREEIVGNVRPMLLVLFGAVALVLLIGCADVAGLLLTRAAGRHREMSIRVAIGASRAQLIRQVLVESLIVALLGGAFGIVFCAWAGGILAHWTGINLPAGNGANINGIALLFTLGLSILTAVLFGMAPALRASQTDVSQGVREAGRGGSVGRKHGQILDALVVGQFALALLLLVGAGLLIRSFSHLLATNPGFRPDHILRLDVSLPPQAYPNAGGVRSFYQQLEQSLPVLPGVKAAGLGSSLPLGINEHRSFLVDGEGKGGQIIPHSTAQIWVMGDFFRAMGIPLQRGRFLDDRDTLNSAPVCVVNETLAKTFWPGRNPIGQRISWGDPKDPWMTIVGVVGNVKDQALNEASGAETYSPWQQVKDKDLIDADTNEFREMTVAVRTANTPTAETQAIERVIHRLDPSLPVTKVATMEAELQDSVRAQRFQTALLGGFASAALFLAALGIGGVLAYSVAQRVSEIGIRMALGANRARVVFMVVTRGMRLALAGTIIGMAAALTITRLLSHVLYETSPYDALTFCAAPVFLCVVGLLAILFPARSAATVDPMQSLRVE